MILLCLFNGFTYLVRRILESYLVYVLRDKFLTEKPIFWFLGRMADASEKFAACTAKGKFDLMSAIAVSG